MNISNIHQGLSKNRAIFGAAYGPVVLFGVIGGGAAKRDAWPGPYRILTVRHRTILRLASEMDCRLREPAQTPAAGLVKQGCDGKPGRVCPDAHPGTAAPAIRDAHHRQHKACAGFPGKQDSRRRVSDPAAAASGIANAAIKFISNCCSFRP